VEYCASAWSPHNKDQIAKVEVIQRRAARFVTNRYHNTSSVGSMIEHLGWETLEARRTQIQLMLLYKITHGLVDISPDNYLMRHTGRTRAGHRYKYAQQGTKTDTLEYRFFQKTIKVWNSLPACVAEAPDLATFKRKLIK
jgi:hypothetical protein